jgi:hypothetical protein
LGGSQKNAEFFPKSRPNPIVKNWEKFVPELRRNMRNPDLQLIFLVPEQSKLANHLTNQVLKDYNRFGAKIA